MFDSAFSGDLWSSAVFSFDSPMKDLLDAGDFTLEQILREDELLQEVKSMTPQLIQFLSEKTTMSKLLHYIVAPPEGEEASTCGNNDAVLPIQLESTASDSSKGEVEETPATGEMGDVAQREQAADGGDLDGKKGIIDEAATDIKDAASEKDIQLEKAALNENKTTASSSNENLADSVVAQETEILSNTNPKTGMLAATFPGQHLRDNTTGEEMELDKSERSMSVQDFDRPSCDDEEQKYCNDEDLKTLRYPYMACEILCMENSSIIDALVGRTYNRFMDVNPADCDLYGCNIAMLNKLFSVLDVPSSQLDDRRAGYFEKILSVLFRIRAATVIGYINECGLELFQKFLRHLGNNSIMQVVQRLMMPPPQTGGGGFEEDDDDDDDMEIVRCIWGINLEAISTLVNKLSLACNYKSEVVPKIIEGYSANRPSEEETYPGDDNNFQSYNDDMAMHLSDLLISLTQQAPADSSVLQFLTQGETVLQVVRNASVLPAGNSSFSPCESPLTSALALLEAILLQLGGFGNVPQVNQSPSVSFASAGANNNTISVNKNQVSDDAADRLANAEDLLAALPEALESWSDLLSNNESLKSNPRWQMPNHFVDDETLSSNKEVQIMLGVSRLRIVRVVEALVLLNHRGIDDELQKHHVLQRCLGLFFEFHWCSMLHQSVANLIVHILESGEGRGELQRYLLTDLRLLEKLLDLFPAGTSPFDETSPRSKVRPGHMGHVIIMCQAIVYACNSPPKAPTGEMTSDALSSPALEASDVVEAPKTVEDSTTSTSDASNEDTAIADDRSVELPEVNEQSAIDRGASDVSKLAQAIAHIPIKAQWDEFISTQLVDITAAQSTNLGGFNAAFESSIDDLGYGMTGTHDDDALEISEGDLDIAVSMIEAMKITHDDDEGVGDRPHLTQEASSTAYRYEDPLGQNDGSLEGGYCSSANEDDDGDDIASGYCDAPVLDLFAGNFDRAEKVICQTNFDAPDASTSPQQEHDDVSSPFAATFASFDNRVSPFVDAARETTKNLTAFDAAFDQVDNAYFDIGVNGLKESDQGAADVEGNTVDAAAPAVEDSPATDPFGDTKVNIDEIF